VDVLITGSRPLEIESTPDIIPEFSAAPRILNAHNCWGCCLLAKRGLQSFRAVGEISIEKRFCILVSSDSAISIANGLARFVKNHRTELRL
jgi:hypothetical protein